MFDIDKCIKYMKEKLNESLVILKNTIKWYNLEE